MVQCLENIFKRLIMNVTGYFFLPICPFVTTTKILTNVSILMTRKPAHNIHLYGQFHAEWREGLIPEAQHIRNGYLIGCGSCYFDLSNSSLAG